MMVSGDPEGETPGDYISKVEFTNDKGNVVETIDPTNKKDPNKTDVAGFTNDELFDFSNPLNAKLLIQNPYSDVRYRLENFTLYKNLPESNFNLDDWRNTAPGTLVFSTPELTIDPGQTIDLSLGPMSTGYALANIDALNIDDLADDTTTSYMIPQSYAQDDVPEPDLMAATGLALASIAIIGARLRRRARVKPTAPELAIGQSE